MNTYVLRYLKTERGWKRRYSLAFETYYQWHKRLKRPYRHGLPTYSRTDVPRKYGFVNPF